MQSSRGLHFEDVACGGVRGKRTVQNSFSGIGGPLREEPRMNSHECSRQPQLEESPSEQGPRRSVAPVIWGQTCHKGTT